MKHLAIFASGKGSNAENICRYFQNHKKIKVVCLFTDRKTSGSFEIAERFQLPCIYLSKEMHAKPNLILSELQSHQVHFIIFAGYLKLMPAEIINIYKNHIVNIHPALLPKYGGKGMYGMNVHEAVCQAAEVETGITIHLVNEKYDEGEIIFQKKTEVNKNDTPAMVAEKIHALEMEWFPKVIEDWVDREQQKD